jgi:hypothetical protein
MSTIATVGLERTHSGPSQRLRRWVSAWRGIAREQCAGAALLGVVVATPALFQLAVVPAAVGWQTFARLLLNAEISAFVLLLALVVADQAADRGSRRLAVYGVAVVIAAIGGALMSLLQAHFIWDAIAVPDVVLRMKQRVNPWVIYTVYVYQAIEWTLVGGLAAYVYVDRREARRMVARLHEAALRHSVQAKTMYESELQTLQARVEPGFLFDTLARVRDLYCVDALAADRVLDELILYLRAAMPRMRDTAAELAQELELARSWIAIVDVSRDVALTIACSADAACARIPSMLLLPLVAALLACRRRDGGAATLRLSATASAQRLRLHVVLCADRFEASAAQTTVDTVRERLAALYGTRASLGLAATDGCLEVTLEMPHETPDGADR